MENMVLLCFMAVLSSSVITSTVRSQMVLSQMVRCYENSNCGDADPVVSTLEECCTRAEDEGFTYQQLQDDTEECQTCPLVVGFPQSTFIGEERGPPHQLEVQRISGTLSGVQVFNVTLSLNEGTNSSDVMLSTTEIRLFESQNNSIILVTHTVDAVAQEFEETYDVVLTPHSLNVIVTNIRVTIEDADEITFSLTEDDYREEEVSGKPLPVIVFKSSSIVLANPVTFRITPMTVERALELSIIDEFEDEDDLSPNRALEADFNTSVITRDFPSNTIDEMPVPIALNDDDINEADEQIFIIFLEIINSTNPSLVKAGRNVSQGRIVDDDFLGIGFTQATYSFVEPDSRMRHEVMLIKEDDRISEQTFGLVVAVGDPISGLSAASPETDNNNSYDYSLLDIDQDLFIFHPNNQSLPFIFFIREDDFIEGTEAFRVSSAPESSSQYPTFQPPQSLGSSIQPAYQNAEIQIIDDEIAIVGFEETMYSVNEAAGVQEVCVVVTNPPPNEELLLQIILLYNSVPGTAAEEDFIPVSFGFIFFDRNASARTTCFNVGIIDDSVTEDVELFSVVLELDTFILQSGILVQPNVTEISIIDNDGPILGTPVNDTVIGDPLFTVPLLVDEDLLTSLGLTKVSLCYEVHGASEQWFNLVTDACVTVNARYVGLTRSLNVIDEIGVRAVNDDNECVNIRVDLEQCSVEVNDVSLNLDQRYSSAGISVRRYGNRVRVSVPNCDELTLVMWVICETRTLDNPDQPGTMLNADMIKFVVMRGLNFGHRAAHGLLGQFWNVPATIAPYTGNLVDGTPAVNVYTVNITTNGDSRVFSGWIHSVTWDLEEGPCIYVGSQQSGPIHEVPAPNNDAVIESLYKDYRVSGAFSEEGYVFGLFQEDVCSDVSE